MAGSAGAVGSAAPVFGVEFTVGGAGSRRGPFGELWSTPFERVAPVRSFPSFRGQASFPGTTVPICYVTDSFLPTGFR